MTQTETPRPPRRPATGGSFSNALTLFRVRGVPVRVDLSWILIALLVVYVFFDRLSDGLGDLGMGVVLACAAAAALLFFASVLAHELGHALTSLDRNIPVLGITLFLMGGVTESSREARTAKDEFVIVGIGPFISLVLAAVFGLLATAAQSVRPLGFVFGYLGWTNLALAIFNVLPGYPLDGGRLLRALLWALTGRPHRATRWAARVGQGFAGLLALGGLWGVLGGPVPAGPAALRFAVQLLASNGLWGLLLGFFLLRGATDSYRRAVVRERLSGRTARQAMGSVPPALDPAMPLSEALLRLQERPSLLWPVGAPVTGVLTLDRIDAVADSDWPSTTVADVAIPADGLTVPGDAGMDIVLEAMAGAPGHMLIVTDGGHAVGLLTASLVAEP
ncbi:hypothetical protein BH23ACT7_BH23ACT7_01810 [soil metagenome]|jgi:Zn-dependent protease/CBS domain-containing protein|nr:site-2 protease family protein [Euzebyaceae bacterium]